MADFKSAPQDNCHEVSHPVAHGQAEDVVTVAFSAQPEQMASCSFLVVAYGSEQGDIGYFLEVAEFLDLSEKVE